MYVQLPSFLQNAWFSAATELPGAIEQVIQHELDQRKAGQARLTWVELRLASSTLSILDGLQTRYMESRAARLPVSVRQERAAAWCTDARTAVDRYPSGDSAELIKNHLHEAEWYAQLEQEA